MSSPAPLTSQPHPHPRPHAQALPSRASPCSRRHALQALPHTRTRTQESLPAQPPVHALKSPTPRPTAAPTCRPCLHGPPRVPGATPCKRGRGRARACARRRACLHSRRSTPQSRQPHPTCTTTRRPCLHGPPCVPGATPCERGRGRACACARARSTACLRSRRPPGRGRGGGAGRQRA